ncbi:MAG: ADP-ribosylglycohydrolase family protein [Lachnospiraceae bacterium]|nr:ADP-ribosylglycohydrolase family protein [Lachnospiraceae bacterium]
MREERNIRLDGIMGVVTGDALGCPVQFKDREEIRGREQGPVTGMEGHGTYDMPVGTWTDDSSMTLALLDSIREKNDIDPDDIMRRFVDWYERGAYTPFGRPFDMGTTCSIAIESFERGADVFTCGGTGERSNGNGSLMRIMPVCLYAYEKVRAGEFTVDAAVRAVHLVSGLTHNHLRSKLACGLYFFMVSAIPDGDGSLRNRLRNGLDAGFAYYSRDIANRTELTYYDRLRDLNTFSGLPETEIRSGGYVVESLEAAVWSLLLTDTYEDALLCAVNLGDDTDSVAAIAGGPAGLFYGYDAIPADWLSVIRRREWIEEMCAG